MECIDNSQYLQILCDMISPEGDDEEFEFYLKIAKPLILNLPNTNDRIKAAAWVRFLKNNNTTDKALRGEYLKLLLFVLQRRTLYGPFATVPNESKPLEQFPAGTNIQDVAKNFTEVDKQILHAKLKRKNQTEWPPYSVACSSDLTEYAAHQEIPNFGVHAYYALSTDPVNYWKQAENTMFPLGESVDMSNQEYHITNTTTPDISCFVSPEQELPVYPGTSQGTSKKGPRVPRQSKPKKGFEDVAPKPQKISCSVQEQDEYNVGNRIAPIWGSNLVNVKEPNPVSWRPPSLFSVTDYEMDATEQDMLDFFNDGLSLYDDDSGSDTNSCCW